MAFYVGIVTAGRAIGTGSDTEIGKINTMIAEVETLASPLARQMAALSKSSSVVIVAMATAMFGVGWLLHD